MALEMPSSGGMHDASVLKALKENTLYEDTLNENIKDVLTLVSKVKSAKKTKKTMDYHALATKAWFF